MLMQNWNTSITIRYHSYESTEDITRFTDYRDPKPREMCSISTNLAPLLVEEGEES
jgi:hypothetical protein